MMTKRKIFFAFILVLAFIIFLGFQFLASQKTHFSFQRNYFPKIKSAFVLPLMRIPGPPWSGQKKASLEDGLLIKERLNANTYSTQVHYGYQRGKFKLGVVGPRKAPPLPEFLIWPDVERQLKSAKEAGLAVNLVVTWGYQGMVKLKDKNDLLNFLAQFPVALSAAGKIAEKYQLEYFSLGEPDHLIRSQSFPFSEREMVAMINAYKEEALAQLRKVYQGQLYYQIGDAEAWDFSQLDVAGLDFFGVLITGETDFSRFKRKVDLVFKRAEELSQRSGLPWVITELWINKNDDRFGLAKERRDYYQYVFNKARNSPHLKGIVIDTWHLNEPGFETSVKDTPAEFLIRDFFGTWQ